MADFGAQLERVRSKLGEVRRAKISTFGAGAHQYRLGPALSEDEVATFERTHGIRIPEAYREFITQIGHAGPGSHGGAGPYYGLYPLSLWTDFMDWVDGPVPQGWLARPCPLVPGRNELPEVDDDLPDDEWPGADHLANFAGVMTIGTRGCTYMTGLIVTGPARGRVVYLDVQYDEHPYVGRDAHFLDWYERWLDELLAGVDASWFGYGPAGDESRLIDLARTSADDDLVAEAVSNLHRQPALTQATWRALAELVAHDDERVRAAAARVFRRGHPEHARFVEGLLGDSAAVVRAAACRTLTHLSPTGSDLVWSLLLMEPDPDVQHAAYHALLADGAMGSERLEALACSEAHAGVAEQARRALAVARSD